MKSFPIALLSVACVGIGIAVSQTVPALGPPTGIACAYNTTPQAITAGQAGWVQCDVNGSIVVASSPAGINAGTPNTPATATATQGVMLGAQYNSTPTGPTEGQQGAIPMDIRRGLFVAGTVAQGVADSGNPVKTGGVYNTTLPSLSTGVRGDKQLTSNGEDRSMMTLITHNPSDGLSNTSFAGRATAGSTDASARVLATFDYIFNGSTWDRPFTCATSTPIGIVAGTTAQIIPLSGSTVIRICNIALSSSLAGTFQVISGTGATCGTATTSITGAMNLATAATITMSGGQGSVFRSPAGHNLCITAVTGNITGVASYVQY